MPISDKADPKAHFVEYVADWCRGGRRVNQHQAAAGAGVRFTKFKSLIAPSGGWSDLIEEGWIEKIESYTSGDDEEFGVHYERGRLMFHAATGQALSRSKIMSNFRRAHPELWPQDAEDTE